MSTQHPAAKPCKIKVCGVREPAQSAALDALGVDWIGYNFHPGSARHILPEAAAPQARSLRGSTPVGVFVDADIHFVIDVVASTGIRCVQLHGNEDWDYVMAMPVPVIKAIPHTRLADFGGLRVGLEEAMRKGLKTPLAYFLVDTQASGAFGGTGRTFDWDLLRRHPLPLPYFLAGGLGPHNLAQALAATAAAPPFAVDLNSKVESSPGLKDLEKVKACMGIAKAAPRS
jgi:phosphoribosylanthranilate isomerase